MAAACSKSFAIWSIVFDPLAISDRKNRDDEPEKFLRYRVLFSRSNVDRPDVSTDFSTADRIFLSMNKINQQMPDGYKVVKIRISVQG
jgi:hypothetical protein